MGLLPSSGRDRWRELRGSTGRPVPAGPTAEGAHPTGPVRTEQDRVSDRVSRSRGWILSVVRGTVENDPDPDRRGGPMSSSVADDRAPALPPVADAEEWQAARDALLTEEKELTRALDRLAARRRRLPMVPFDASYAFEGPNGTTTLLDLFEGRRQLAVYQF